MSKRHRSAVTGEYVTEAEAKADPERTVSERVTLTVDTSELTKLVDDIKEQLVGRMASLEAEVAMLQTQVQTLEAAVAALQAGK